MKIHIVAGGSVPTENRIITRLAKVLETETGWTRSAKPDSRAYLNVYIPYLNRAEVTVETKSAAWFTHRDESLRPKVAVWKHIARAVQLRVTSARIYLPELSEIGPTRLVTPPLDREKFQPAKHVQGKRPVVGTSGFVYNWGRKGEDLMGQLAACPLGAGVEWVAAGRGWPIPCKFYPWNELHRFYQSLDLYVCTSLIEGVGYGPLEALASGVKVVVPSQVGVFDDLPEQAGIRHYQAGDKADLQRAFARCLDDPHDAEALRETTAGYTVQAWVKGWQDAVAEVFGGKPEPSTVPSEGGAAALAVPDTCQAVAAVASARPVPDPAPAPLPSSRGRAGLFLVAFGEPSRKCAGRCIDAFKRHNPDLPVALCAEKPLGPEDMLIVQRDVDIGARAPKVRVYDLAPAEWEYVLYLDADTEVRGSVDPILAWLSQGWELVICNNPGKFALAANMGRMDNSGECKETFDLWGTDQMMQLGGGVFAFRRCEATARLFHRWAEEWAHYGKRDQGALLRAIWHEPVRTLMLLPRVWNCVAQSDEARPGKLKYPYDEPKDAAIMHYPMTARRWQGIVPERSDSAQAWARVREWEKSHGKVAVR